MKKNELQSVSFDWYSINRKSHINKINKRKKAITYSFEAQITNRFFPVFKGHYKLTLGRVLRVF